MKDADLLAEIEDCIRTMPPREQVSWDDDTTLMWVGRAAAVINAWDAIKAAAYFRSYMDQLRSPMLSDSASTSIVAMLHEARYAVRLRVGPTTVAVDAGNPFEYFEQLRNVIASASTDILFVDRHLEGDFVSRYLTQVRPEVEVRLLTRDRVRQLIPAVELFRLQEQRRVSVRSHQEVHDRFVFIDRELCYFSGASFKDGGRQSPALFSQIISCAAFIQQYEGMWASAKVESPPER